MKSPTQEELELQKNRLEILKMSGKADMIQTHASTEDGRYAWQYELDFYKSLKRRERFYFVGAACGILSLVLTLALHYETVLKWLQIYP